MSKILGCIFILHHTIWPVCAVDTLLKEGFGLSVKMCFKTFKPLSAMLNVDLSVCIPKSSYVNISEVNLFDGGVWNLFGKFSFPPRLRSRFKEIYWIAHNGGFCKKKTGAETNSGEKYFPFWNTARQYKEDGRKLLANFLLMSFPGYYFFVIHKQNISLLKVFIAAEHKDDVKISLCFFFLCEILMFAS